MITGWLLSKFDGNKPVVDSLSIMWRAPEAPFTPDGWALVHVYCQPVHLEFFKSDPDVIWIGNEWSKVPPEVLSTYSAQLGTDTYAFMGQVIDKLLEWEPRFHEKADAWCPRA